MRKSLKFLLLVLCVGFIFTGCGKKKDGDTNTSTKKDDSMKEVVISDDGFGVTKLKYSKDKDYEVKTEEGGKYTTVIISSKEENFKLELYHFDTFIGTYEDGQDSRSTSDEYKEYKWNGFNGYSYHGDKYSIDMNILLKENDNKAKALFGTMSYEDYKSANVSETFKSKDVQDLLNSITFEEK